MEVARALVNVPQGSDTAPCKGLTDFLYGIFLDVCSQKENREISVDAHTWIVEDGQVCFQLTLIAGIVL
jgi:hypothetical protein